MSSRFPSSCSAGFISHYFVIPGDTMSIIAKRFDISEKELIAVNPHIADPNVLFSRGCTMCAGVP